MMSRKGKISAPIFEQYSLTELTELLPYRETYLLDLKRGNAVLTERFRKTACGILRRSEAELFGDAAQEARERVLSEGE